MAAMLVSAFAATTLHDAAAQNGHALAQEHCAMCHAIGKSGTSPHREAPPLRRISASYNLDEFAELLQRGRLLAPHPDMPAFKFDRARARALTNYLRSIQE